MDIVMSINMGADDYMTKPFEPSVHAKLRMMVSQLEFVQQKDWLEYKGIACNWKRKFRYEGNVIELEMKNEFIILRVLFENIAILR